MKRSNRWAAALVAAALISAGACGTSGGKRSSATQPPNRASSTTDQSATSTPPSTGPTSSGPTSEPANPQDEARAKAANIVPGDFPPGWTPTEHAEGTSKVFATCAPDIDLEAETTAQASSPDFTREVGSSQTQANSVTRVLSAQSVAKAVIARIGEASFVTCVDKAIKREGLKPGTATGTLSSVEVPNLGDGAAGIDGKVSGVDSGTGKDVTVGVSIIAIRKGDLVTVLTGASLNGTQSGDAVLFQKLAQAISDRQRS